MSGVFLFIFTLFWSGMVLMFDGLMLHGIYKQFESQNFPSVDGTITHSEVTSHRGSKGGTSYDAVINYRYEIGGQKFEGDKLRFGMKVSSYESANASVSAHPVGSTAQVFYNPANPQESLLSPGVNGSDFTMALFLTPFNMVMLGFWIWIGGWLRERFFRPVAGGVKIIADGMTTRIRLPRMPAIAWGLGTTGGLGFISIFAVGFGAKMEPSIPLILSVIAAVYVSGMAVYFWQLRKINSGIDDLILNEASRTIELPLTFGRKERVAVKVADIKSLSVEKIEHRSSKGGISYTYASTLGLRETGVAVQKLADWSDKLKADEFADWLRKQLGPDISTTLEVAPTIDDADEASSRQLVEEIRPDGHSRIKVTDGPEGREFYFPPARNIGTALLVTLFMVIFNGIAVLAFHLHAPILFPIVFGLFGVLLIFGTVSAWFKSSRVTIDSTNVRATNRWLVFSRTRQFSTGDVSRFTTKIGMQSGSQVFTDIKLIPRGSDDTFAARKEKFQDASTSDADKVMARFREAAGPSGVTVAGSIASVAEANWLVQEMNKALGHT
jgi:Protein of unknown function (DUF3592)